MIETRIHLPFAGFSVGGVELPVPGLSIRSIQSAGEPTAPAGADAAGDADGFASVLASARVIAESTSGPRGHAMLEILDYIRRAQAYRSRGIAARSH